MTALDGPVRVGEWVIYTRGGGNGDTLALVLRVIRGDSVELDFGHGQSALASDVRPGNGEPHTYRRMGIEPVSETSCLACSHPAHRGRRCCRTVATSYPRIGPGMVAFQSAPCGCELGT
jgi:hypothetical protein